MSPYGIMTNSKGSTVINLRNIERFSVLKVGAVKTSKKEGYKVKVWCACNKNV